MTLSTLKDKGQITLPAVIRKRIRANVGDMFDFEVVGNKVVMTLQKVVPAASRPEKKQPVDLSKYIGVTAGVFGSVEEIDDYIREERDSWD